mgnify:CR=1 FL=1
MIKITVVLPYKEMRDLFLETFKVHDEYISKQGNEVDEYTLETVVAASAEEVNNLKLDSDVIVARGATAYGLRRRNYYIPVVEIPVFAHDLTRALYESKTKFVNKKTGVIGSANMIIGVENLSDIMGMEINPYVFTDNSEIKHLVDQAVKEGVEVVIGGIYTCAYGEELGIDTVLIKSGKEAIWYALSEAKRAATISRREQEKALRFKTILDYAYEGVIAVDDRNIISVFNTTAEKTLHLNAQRTIGKKFEDVIPKSLQKAITQKDEECFGEIIRYNDTNLAINKVPIILKSEKLGEVITFQDVTHIQEMESIIRKKIYTRGHVARYTFEDIIGENKSIVNTVQIVKRFSEVGSNILLYGETGTGKEIFAQSIHNHSGRKKGPFVAVNCAALPESLLESELFGYAEGAFTGAIKGGKPGLFELAHTGTIFLDEISEISHKLQGRLLRVLEEKEIMRLGHDKVIPVDIRIISATNKDLNTLVEKGDFREDLYYRLDILKIHVPALRERGEDILLIADHYTRRFCQKFGKENISLSPEVKEKFMRYTWPGNIRELRNVCERLVVLNQSGVAGEEDIEMVFPGRGALKSNMDVKPVDNSPVMDNHFEEQVQKLERDRITAVLKEAGRNKAKAAETLGISRTTLWRRMKELGIVQ